MSSVPAEARTSRGNLSLCETIRDHLIVIDERVVFAESCTGGEIVSTMTKLPGISKVLCGSLVSYRASCKQGWLGVDCRTIEKHSTESEEVAREMALGALRKTPEASWALSVVGHLGPDAPPELDGHIFVCVVRRTRKGKLKVKEESEHQLGATDDRLVRQRMATEVCLTQMGRALTKAAVKHDKKQKQSIEKKKVVVI